MKKWGLNQLSYYNILFTSVLANSHFYSLKKLLNFAYLKKERLVEYHATDIHAPKSLQY